MTRHDCSQPTRAPGVQGLYDPRLEHDACGVGFVVNIKGVRSHKLVDQALEVAIGLLQRMRRNIAARSMLAGWLADDQWRELEWDV